ncbi:hypothetical protein Tco_0025069 [Tanacetum coccineum]
MFISDMALPPRDLRHQYLRFEELQYIDVDIAYFETRPEYSERLCLSWIRLELVGFGAYWAESVRQIPDKGDLSAYWIGISLIAYNIDGRSQAPEKVTVTNLFYLRGMDVGSINVPYLLARYLRLFASGRKQRAMIFGGEFVLVWPEQFGNYLLGETPWMTWMQYVVAAGAPEAAENALVADEGALAVPEDVHEIRGALGEQREVLDSMAHDFSRFSTWTVVGLSHMMSQAGVRYTSYADFQIPYVRRTRRGTADA